MRGWLVRLFGGWSVRKDDEPARFAPPSVRPVQPKRGIHPDKGAGKVKSGFDPYNSGSFERHNAWERVIRR